MYNQKSEQKQNTQTQGFQKKTLILFGKMGQGKSAIINTLISPKNGQLTSEIKQKLLKSQISVETVTKDCYLRQAHRSHNLLPNSETLYLMDTPGLDSQTSMCLVSEKIDNMIISERCNIIGIAYVMDLFGNREIGINKQSTIKDFLKILKIKKQLKNAITFIILSKWDSAVLKNEEQIIRVQKSLYDLIKELELQNTGSNIIRWTNRELISKKIIDFFINQLNGKVIIEQQWQNLKKILGSNIDSGLSLKSEQHLSNLMIFWQNFQEKINQQILKNNIRYCQESELLDIQFENVVQDFSLIQQVKQTVTNFIQSSGENRHENKFISLGINVALIGYSLYQTILNWKQQKDKKIIEKKQIQQQQILQSERIKLEFLKQVEKKLKSSFLLRIFKKIKTLQSGLLLESIGNHIRVNKLSIFYISKLYDRQNGDRSIRNVPLFCLNKQELKQVLRLKYQFQNGDRDRIQELEQRARKLFRENPSQFGKENKAKIYLTGNQSKIVLRLQAQCQFPTKQNYNSLIVQQCGKMFGQYN